MRSTGLSQTAELRIRRPNKHPKPASHSGLQVSNCPAVRRMGRCGRRSCALSSGIAEWLDNLQLRLSLHSSKLRDRCRDIKTTCRKSQVSGNCVSFSMFGTPSVVCTSATANSWNRTRQVGVETKHEKCLTTKIGFCFVLTNGCVRQCLFHGRGPA